MTYSALPYGWNNFGVKATDLAGNLGTAAKASWYISRTAGATVSDTGFSTGPRVAMGTTMTWTNIGAAQHTVTDKRLDLFDSGPLDPGGAFAFFLNGASTYTVMSTLDAFPTQQISVRPTAVPTSGTTATSFTITWAAMVPPSDLLFDVYLKRPGASQFVQWQLGATGTSAQFVPDAGPGTYSFYARMRSIADLTEANSPQVSLTVS